MDKARPVCKDAKEISLYVGIDPKRIKFFKEKYGLPAWRFAEGGNWKAVKSSLDKWLQEMESKHL